MPETTHILVKLSLAEAAMVKKLREYPFGQFTIHKTNGEPIRIVIGGSEIIDAKEGMALAERES